MATAPPVISFITATPTTVSVGLAAPIPIAPLFDHFLVFAYAYLTNEQVHASGSVAGPSYTVVGLDRGRAYIITAVAVDTGGEFSLPSEQLVVAETNAHNNAVGLPQILNAAGVQESLAKVRIDFDLKDAINTFGEVTVAEYSFDGTFTDAITMKESFDHPAKAQLFMVEALVEYLSEPGDIVVDPFGGPGTCLVCVPMGRGGGRLELMEEYRELIRKNTNTVKTAASQQDTTLAHSTLDPTP